MFAHGLKAFFPSEKLRFRIASRTLKKNQRFQSSLDWITAFRESAPQEPQGALSEGVVRSTFPLSSTVASGGTFRWFWGLSKMYDNSFKNSKLFNFEQCFSCWFWNEKVFSESSKSQYQFGIRFLACIADVCSALRWYFSFLMFILNRSSRWISVEYLIPTVFSGSNLGMLKILKAVKIISCSNLMMRFLRLSVQSTFACLKSCFLGDL